MRIFLMLFLTVFYLQANDFSLKIENLIGQKNYKTHKNLLKIIFANQNEFIFANGELNYVQIFKKLKQNGLLNLRLPSAREIEVEFRTNAKPIKSLKILNDTLNALGYYYYFTKNMKQDDNGQFSWTIVMKTQSVIDPQVLISEISKNNGRILNIEVEENNKWIYEINTSFASIADSIFIGSNETKVLQKPLKAYFINIEKGSAVEIQSNKQDRWHPHVVFYDEDLSILKVEKRTKFFRKAAFKIPEKTNYIKITDLFALDNIKRGLTVTIKE